MPQKEAKLKKVSNLFDKYKKNLKAPQGFVVGVFCELVEELYGFSVQKEGVKYTTHTKILSLQISGPIKTEILMRKKEILTHLKGRLGEKSAPKEII